MKPSGAQRRALANDYEAIATWWYHEDTQTFIKGQPNPATSLAQKALSCVKSIYPKKKQPWLDPDAITMFLRAASTASAGHTFFVTKQGYYGLGRPRVGDQVFVLHGGVVPFLLRSVGPLNYFQLVGDCYLQGIMYGEAMEGWEEKTQALVLVGKIKPRL